MGAAKLYAAVVIAQLTGISTKTALNMVSNCSSLDQLAAAIDIAREQVGQ